MTTGADIVGYARQQLGKPYIFGDEGPNTFDCSGLVQYVYQHFGIRTPRTTYQMVDSSALKPIARKDLREGDLIFSNWGDGPNSHVGIYAGNNRLIEAGSPDTGVTTSTLGSGYLSHVTGYRRVSGLDGDPAPAGSGGVVGAVLAGAQAATGALIPGSQVITGLIPNPGNVTEALTNIGGAMIGIGQSAAAVGNTAQLITRAFLPSNILRGVFFFFGVISLLIGVWFISRELKESA